MPSQIVKLDVGGEIVKTPLRTLVGFKDSNLERMFSNDYDISR